MYHFPTRIHNLGFLFKIIKAQQLRKNLNLNEDTNTVNHIISYNVNDPTFCTIKFRVKDEEDLLKINISILKQYVTQQYQADCYFSSCKNYSHVKTENISYM